MDGLEGRVAVVTGASRGLGKGIAHELGVAGATVYLTGRTRRGETGADGTRGTIDATADLVTEAGGRGIPVEVDHTDDAQVAALAELIAEEQGRLDLLVNNVWAGYEGYDPADWEVPFWEEPVSWWDSMMDPGVRGHYTAAQAMLPLLLEADQALIVGISAGDEGKYLGDVVYDVAKHAQQRLAFAMAQALEGHGVASLAVVSGFARTERVLDAYELPDDGEAWREVEDLAETHSPRFVGRAVVALARDPDIMARSGGTYKVGQLGLDLGFTDIDGRQPEPWALPDEPPDRSTSVTEAS